MIERYPLIEIESDSYKLEAEFSSNGKYIFSRGNVEVEVWRVKDGERIARMETESQTYCLAVSPDGRWIAVGTMGGGVYVWDANTYEQAFILQSNDFITSVDFSPDSARIAGLNNGMVIVWDVATRERVLGPLGQEHHLNTVKYSPQGDRIATGSTTFIQIYDGHDGRFLVNIPVAMQSHFCWSKDQLFIMSSDKIVQVNSSSGATIAEWPVPLQFGQIFALPHYGEFLVYSSWGTITLWDTSMRQRCDTIQNLGAVTSMSFSRDDHFIAITHNYRNIFIREVFQMTVPFIDLPGVVLRHWLGDQLAEVEEFLTKKITSSPNPPSHYAYRALIRARLGCWKAAIEDAEKSIEANPSMIGCIAKSVAHTGGGDKEKVGRMFDLASRHLQMYDSVDPLLLIKAVVLFMAGDHDEAILRVNDLIATLHLNSICYMVLAYMHLLLGDSHMDNNDHENAIQLYEQAQSEIPSYVGPLLHTISLISGWKFDNLGITVRQHLCEALYAAGRTRAAGDCIVSMMNSFNEEVYVRGSISKWVSDFLRRYGSTSEGNWILDFTPQWVDNVAHFGDVATDTQRYDDAVVHYLAALSLDGSIPHKVLVKRSKARAAMGLWQDALNDANEVIDLDPTSPWGYERKYVALGVAGLHKEKSDAFEIMVSKMVQSSDPAARERGFQYPKTRETIHEVIQSTIQDFPPVLINITSGRLYDRSEQVLAFELSPSYAEFTSTMTAQMDMPHIRREVEEYYRYATFSHKNEANEPLFDEISNASVYKLEESLTHEKLRRFCQVVLDSGFHWAWSNTCCIDRSNHSVLEEALASMFRWYQESALTVVHLPDVCSPSQQGDLTKSVWNTRAWMFQEYHASRVVRFYNNDWTLYRNLDAPNHKELPDIVVEIEEATGMPTFTWGSLSPGLLGIRSKLYIASRRETTLVEDAAYSLFGIFLLSLPVVYGEGDKALGHLLSYLLTKSSDVSILAWTGTSGTFNSCLPSNTSVFHEQFPSHVQPFIENAVDEVATGLRSSSQNITFLTKLIDLLKELPSPWFVGQELKLPCFTFKIGSVSVSEIDSVRVFHIQAAGLGDIELRTRDDLSRSESLYLVFPWIDFLFDRQPRGSPQSQEEESEYEASAEDVLAFPTRSNINVPLGTLVQERASRFVARLKQFRRRRPRSESPPPTPVEPFTTLPAPLPFVPPRTPSPVPAPFAPPWGAPPPPPPVPVHFPPPFIPAEPIMLPPVPAPFRPPPGPVNPIPPIPPAPFMHRRRPMRPIPETRQMKAVRFAARLRQPFDALLMAPHDHEEGKYRRVAADCRITVQLKEITALVLKQLLEGVQVLGVL